MQHLKHMRDKYASGVKFSNDEIDKFFCELCALGKAHRAPIHHSPMTQCTVVGEEIHWDVCGPMPPSLEGHTYLVLGIDAASRFIFIGFHKTKKTVFSTIQETIKRVDTQRGQHNVKRIHTDNGGEFLSHVNQKWIAGKGIAFTTNAAHIP